MDKTKAQLTSLIPMSDNSPAIDAGQLIQRPPFDCFMDSAEMDEIRSSKLPTKSSMVASRFLDCFSSVYLNNF